MTEQVASGLRAWTIQRLSAVYILVFTLYAGAGFASRGASGFEPWVTWLRDPFNNIAVGLFILALLFHAWVGARDIILDYVKAPGLRLVKLAVLALVLIAMGLWAFKVLLTVVIR
ncbi:MAG TPA: succinate dehydrogenase, hydrophobic membrane anchor protein [Gammaproteobacteria bacterium]